MVVVAAIATLWAVAAGDPTARLLRGAFAAASPMALVVAVAALLMLGVALRVVPSASRPRILAGDSRLRGWRLRAAAGRVPVVVWLSAIVALAAVIRTVLNEASHTPKILGDELIYAGLAKGWALDGMPVLRGSVHVGHSTLYPLLLAPVFRLASDGASALAAARTVNAIAMALAAVPAFMLARRVVPRGWALGVAALSALAPWTAYAGLIVTESLFYPAFVAYAAVLAWTLERPSVRRQAAMLALLGVLVGARAQGLAVGLGALAAIVLWGALDRDLRATIRRFLPTLAVFALAVVVGLAAAATGVAVPTSSYNPVFDSLDRIGGMLEWGAWNLSLFQTSLGVVALTALPIALSALLRRGAPAAARACGVVTVTLSLGLLASVALLSASTYGLDILHERSLFYVTPLVLTCFADWLRRGLERPFWLSAACGAASLTLAAVLPERLIVHSNDFDAPTASFVLALDERLPAVPFRVWALGIAAVGVGTFLLARRPLFPIATVVLAFVFLGSNVDFRDRMTAAQARSLAWVDHALPDSASADLVYLGSTYPGVQCQADRAQQGLTVWTEFFNRRIRAVRYVRYPNPGDGLGSEPLTVERDEHVLDAGEPFDSRYVAIDARQPIVGERIASMSISSEEGGRAMLTLWRVDPPLRFVPLRRPVGGLRGRGPNLIPNGSFEDDRIEWTANAGGERIERTTERAARGEASLSVETSDTLFSGAFLTTRIPVEPGTSYVFSFLARAPSPELVLPTVEWFDGESLTRLDQPPGVTVGGSWTPVVFAVTSPEHVDHAIVAVALAGRQRATFQLDTARFAAGGPGGC
jgi:Carbohydrate binding domain